MCCIRWQCRIMVTGRTCSGCTSSFLRQQLFVTSSACTTWERTSTLSHDQPRTLPCTSRPHTVASTSSTNFSFSEPTTKSSTAQARLQKLWPLNTATQLPLSCSAGELMCFPELPSYPFLLTLRASLFSVSFGCPTPVTSQSPCGLQVQLPLTPQIESRRQVISSAGGPESGNRVKQEQWDKFKTSLSEHNVNSISRSSSPQLFKKIQLSFQDMKKWQELRRHPSPCMRKPGILQPLIFTTDPF